jgi:hypothetical protein
VRSAKQGEALAHHFTVRGVFGVHAVFIADQPHAALEEGGGELPGALPATPPGPAAPPASCRSASPAALPAGPAAAAAWRCRAAAGRPSPTTPR